MLINLQISFVLPMDAIPGRIGLLLTLLLCSINIFNSTETKYPKNSFAIVDWILSCIIYITLPLLEYAILLGYKKYKTPAHVNGKDSRRERYIQKIEKLSKWVDKLMLIIFPPTFTIFAVLFWIEL